MPKCYCYQNYIYCKKCGNLFCSKCKRIFEDWSQCTLGTGYGRSIVAWDDGRERKTGDCIHPREFRVNV